MLIQQRQTFKDGYPGMWDGSFIPYRIPLIGLLFTLREGIGKNCPI